MRRTLLFSSLILIGAVITSCCATKKTEIVNKDSLTSIPGPKVIIYQTTNDYTMFVPVILNDDGNALVSYPDIQDVYFDGKLSIPTALNKGYLLDNRGIDKNVAFLNLTYEAYSKLSKTPSPEELMNMIIDKHPLTVMYSCGTRPSYRNIEQELNAKIDAGDFSSFMKIK